jgi:hypothetical protein
MSSNGLPPLPLSEYSDEYDCRLLYTEEQMQQYGVACRLQALRDAAKECAGIAASYGALEASMHAAGHHAAACLDGAYRSAAEHCEQAIQCLLDFDYVEGDATSSPEPDTERPATS